MSASEIATLKTFFVEKYGICDIRSNFRHTFGVPGGFAPDPTQGSIPVWTPPLTEPSFVPLRNKFLAIRNDIMTSSVSLYCVQKMTDNNISWVAGCRMSTIRPHTGWLCLLRMWLQRLSNNRQGIHCGDGLLTVDMYSCRLPKAPAQAMLKPLPSACF